MMQTIEHQIRTYINRRYTVFQSFIDSNHLFRQDLGLSEWEFLDVLVHFEHLFGVSLPDEVITQPLTIEQLSCLIYHHKAGTNGSVDQMLKN